MMDNFRVAFQNTYELQATAAWEKKEHTDEAY